jgi:hypothetical protein
MELNILERRRELDSEAITLGIRQGIFKYDLIARIRSGVYEENICRLRFWVIQ